jgi:hypothetical protein
MIQEFGYDKCLDDILKGLHRCFATNLFSDAVPGVNRAW